MAEHTGNKPVTGLYRHEFEKDGCGFGLIAHMDGVPSQWLVRTAIQSLARLTHRGAIAADGKTGDGCGILLKKPEVFLRAAGLESGFEPGPNFAIGMVFLNPDADRAERARRQLKQELTAKGLSVLGWREVPIDTSACGAEALKTLPRIEQIYVDAPEGMADDDFERLLYLARRRAEKALRPDDTVFYVPSLSSRVINYKGLIMPHNLPVFYPELSDPRMASSLCVFHQRFSTNTCPQWQLAQPFHYLAHNGEINTIQGNRNWSVAHSYKFSSPLIPDMAELRPWVDMCGSDSCTLDNMLEVLVAGGMDIFRAMRLLMPPAWQNIDTMDADLRAFYEYHSMHMEPWDGPAGIVLTDSRYAACIMDRNGLRPARYVITRDRHITLASEIGVYDYRPQDVVMKGRLGPGEMIAADTSNGRLLLPADIDARLKNARPYQDWIGRYARRLGTTAQPEPLTRQPMDAQQLSVYQKLFLVTYEERDQILRVLAEAGQEAVGSMGDDTPLPVLSRVIRPLYDSFRQQFAQVTNPPIDSLREQIVMSLETCLGRAQNLFEQTQQQAARLVICSPVLSERLFQRLLAVDDPDYAATVIDLNVPDSMDLKQAIESVCDTAVEAVSNGSVILVLSDRSVAPGRLPIHALLATAAVHHRLIREGLRSDANLIVETATARDPHHFAVLIGHGATAVYPYLAYQCLAEMLRSGEIPGGDSAKLCRAYRQGIDKGLLKIISKMGISTISSYRGAQLFEIIGLHDEVIELCFQGSISRLQGMRFADLHQDQRRLAAQAWNPRRPIAQGGLLKYVYGSEYHAFNPEVIGSLQAAVESNDYHKYLVFARQVNQRPVTVIRDLLRLRPAAAPIPIEDVEPIEAILPRFDTAGMSLGALAPQAHEDLAIAMNRLGGRSNSGEGGEDPRRYGTERCSKIKQVASARFGVTAHYLVNAEVLQIKIAQGAKPGEGGQLLGPKVNKMIARLRCSKPGVALISPPPHHDIYSIEDLAQLIFDLKQVNPQVLVSVKLVAEPGVGTIATGVAKAYADLITIAGYDGGTGASPLTSVRYAGCPWELGLAETHQALRANNLRDQVRLQTDGGLKTGLDVIKAAILGAESFGFGTAPMVALGCKYLRICHLNNCATGIATQNKVLRMQHYKPNGPDKVINYFRFVAREVRERLAVLGMRRLEEIIGRTDLLEMLPGESDKQKALDLSPILSTHGLPQDRPQYCTQPRNAPFDKGELAERMVADTLVAIKHRRGGEFHYTLRNDNRSIGARLSGEIAKRYGNRGMDNAPIVLRLKGTAGQSFGVWNAGGLHLHLAGDANDYVGKGMAGGKIVIHPPAESAFNSHQTVIIGNTCLYGATGGRLFAAGIAGERFAVRNSGACAVVEGIGEHGCEYMTGGVVTVLGQTGLNFGAGMTGGFAFVLDENNLFQDSCNHELVDSHRIVAQQMEPLRHYLRSMIEEFSRETGSEWGLTIREAFPDYVGKFWLIKPKAADFDSLFENLSVAA